MQSSMWVRKSLWKCSLLGVSLALLVTTEVRGAQNDERAADLQAPVVRPLHHTVTVSIDDLLLDEALQVLEAQAGVGLIYSPTRLPGHRVTCECADLRVWQVLERLLRHSGMRFSELGKFIVIEPGERGQLSLTPTLAQDRTPLTPSQLNGGSSMRQMFRSSSGRALAGALGGIVLSAAPLAAQTGTITGQVSDSQTGQPVAAAQVFINTLSLGVLTQQNGRYVLANVPPGPHDVSVRRIGFRDVSQRVVVGAGESVNIDFLITQAALQLDQIVVTGTPGGTQRRAVGNVVASISAEDLTERAPINNMQDLLTGRTPGVNFGRASGNIGGGSEVRIRGFSSLTLGQQPLIYVDGVRVDNSSSLGPALRGAADRQGSALDDINPDDIESIEVIKGPAAATLYGTEASAGVIQIITKRGASGAPEFNLSVTQGTNFMIDPAGKFGMQYGTDPATGALIEGFDGYRNVYEYEKEVHGRDHFQYGHNQAYNLSARGGTDLIRYFVSGTYHDNEGIVSYNYDQRLALRANLSALLSDNLNIDVSTSYTNGLTSYAQQLSEPGGIWEIMLWGQPALKDSNRRGFMRYTPEEIATVSATRDYSRFTGSATFTHDLGGWLRQRLIMGMDHSADENQVLVPRHAQGTASAFGGIGLGEVSLDRPTNRETTLDYAVSANYRLNDALGFTTSVGAQYYRSMRNVLLTRASVFAAPSLRSIAGATGSPFVTQTLVENKTLGIYIQQELSLNNRVFLTAAVRGDDNSAFGSAYDAAIYPKVSATWVVSEEPFWMLPQVSTLRLRSALGQSGRQPDTFDAVTLYQPTTGRGGQPAMLPQTFGNPNVGPEVSTEVEVGFDYGLFEDRFSGEFTYYHQRTTDALSNLPLAPTLGFSGAEVVNIGQLNNWGWEATMNARVVTRPRWSFDLGLAGTHNMNKIIDLGPRPETANIRVGVPFPIETSAIILSADPNPSGSGRPVNVMCDSGTGPGGLYPGGPAVPCNDPSVLSKRLIIGTRFPTHTWNVDGTFSLGQSVQLFALMQGEHGRTGQTTNLWCRFAGCFNNARVANTLDDPIYIESEVFRLEHPNDRTLVGLYDASFWKLRQVGARYSLPGAVVRYLGTERASLSMSGNNLWTIWVAQKHLYDGVPIPDPELQNVTGTGADLGQMPGLASFTVRLDITF